MRCPSCGDDYEPGVLVCADCHVPLSDGHGDHVAPDDPSERLGRFHPALAASIGRELDQRGVTHVDRVHDDAVEVLVDGRVRNELRAELVGLWPTLLGSVDDAHASEVRALDDDLPGWFDAPRGGHIDRHGRLVVDTADDDDADASRVIGPALLAGGAVVAFVGWSVLDVAAIVVVGVGLVLAGLFVPR